MINIAPTAFIGEGSHRICYQHPEDLNLCIKIGEINSKESLRERECYQVLKKRTISWDALSHFHGLVETNLGKGAVFELVRDYDGAISQSLEYYLEKYPALTDITSEQKDVMYEEISRAIGQLKIDLLNNTILTRSLLGENVLFKKTSENSGRLVIIDNIGNTDYFPFCNYSKYLSRRKISRKWEKFERYMVKNYSSHPITKTAINSTS